MWIILALAFPAILASAGALAYYGYLYTEDVSLRMEDAFRETARLDATRLSDAVESRIDAMTRALLEQIELDDEDGDKIDACRVDPRPYVDSYTVVRFDGTGTMSIICTGGFELPGWGTAKRSGTTPGSYLKSLDFGSVQLGNFRYLHQRFEREDVLIAYMRKQTLAGKVYFLAARIDSGAVARIVNDEIATLQFRRRVTVLDQRRRTVAGDVLAEPPRKGHRFLFETPFGKTLYAWDLQVAPWDVEALQAQAQKQRVMGPVLVLLSVTTIAVGLVVVWFGVMAERRASQMKSDFIANVSHELKTPLSLIRMFGELIATGRHKGDTAAREYGEIITRESERLSHLIDNVLDFARVERGKASYQFGEGHLGELVERSLDVCRYRLEKEKMRLELSIDPGLPTVRMDEDAMTLLVLNLVDNAIKYGADGGVLAVSLARAPGQVVLRVRDYGPGIPREECEKIFERFYRARNARDRNVRGSGIGLSLVRHIAAAHGGRVVTEQPASEGGKPGRGIAFCVYLPAPVAEPVSGTGTAPASTPSA